MKIYKNYTSGVPYLIVIHFVILISCNQKEKSNVFSSDNWKYICVDSTREIMRSDMDKGAWFFGMDTGDINADGYIDIASGKWIYLNPKGKVNETWKRITLKDSLDILFCTNVDGDEYIDMIALKCNQQYWLELMPNSSDSIHYQLIGDAEICNHKISSQGYHKADILKGGREEFLLTDKPGKIICYQIPDNANSLWPYIVITEDGASEKGLATMDMDGDGDLDIIASNEKEGWHLFWFENPGSFIGNWKKYEIGNTDFVANNIIIEDIDGDGHKDIIVSEGRWPGLEPDASIYWFKNPNTDDRSVKWEHTVIGKQFSTNSLSAADIDDDGDIDLVTAEHRGPHRKLQIWENNGKGVFTENIIDQGKENHLGARLVDLDNDGDLDIVGFGWIDYKYLHVWENNSIHR